ncbi:hypothetical protein GUJ93_ZPchr0009g1162 [Zizania palustris]|uniref:Pirin C-terminal domain-containing protein n=1 Tax=Zizania palustris TaxID=103762 RepID=A0A8J5UY89_ZIZPA|nr:hypothetical protein GUJ93_ZPchr0009g1162 [Zizania palustris]
MYLDFTVRPHAAARRAVCAAWNAFAYVLEPGGRGRVRRREGRGAAPPAAARCSACRETASRYVRNKSDKPLRFLLIVAGEPIGEPVAQLGPFVMNTEEEIDMTINDLEYNINGFEKAKQKKSQSI